MFNRRSLNLVRNRRYRRHGVTYVAVLMTAMIVTIAALSGLSTARSRLRSVDGTSHTTRARFYAESAVEMGLHAIGANANWRTTYANDEWTAERVIGDGGYAWKIVDEDDGNLAAGPPGPVRLYGKGVADDAVRIYSVQLKPKAAPNLVRNSGFEVGTMGWSVLGNCTFEVSTANPYTGEAHGRVTNPLLGLGAGIIYDITSEITSGTTYYAEVWVGGTSVVPKFDIVLDATGGQQTIPLGSRLVGVGWQKLSGSGTFAWTGTLNNAYLKVSELVTPLVTYRVDDAMLVEGNSPPETPMVPVPGTWQRKAGS